MWTGTYSALDCEESAEEELIFVQAEAQIAGMTVEEFTPENQLAFRQGTAAAIGVQADEVIITSVTAVDDSRRRRQLLTSGLVVEFAVAAINANDAKAAAAALADIEEEPELLVSALELAEFSQASAVQVESVSIAMEPDALETGGGGEDNMGLGIGVGICIMVGAALCCGVPYAYLMKRRDNASPGAKYSAPPPHFTNMGATPPQAVEQAGPGAIGSRRLSESDHAAGSINSPPAMARPIQPQHPPPEIDHYGPVASPRPDPIDEFFEEELLQPPVQPAPTRMPADAVSLGGTTVTLAEGGNASPEHGAVYEPPIKEEEDIPGSDDDKGFDLELDDIFPTEARSEPDEALPSDAGSELDDILPTEAPAAAAPPTGSGSSTSSGY